MATALDLFSTVIIAAGVALCGLGYLSYRRWDEPGSTMFGLFLVGWGALPLLDTLANVVVGAPGVSGFFWVLTVVPWCLFSLRYTGRSFGRRTGVVLLAPALGLLPWFWSVTTDAGILAFETIGIFLFAYYTAVAIIGALVVLRAAGRYGHLSVTEGVWLALAGVIPPATMNAFGIAIDRSPEVVAFGAYAVGMTAMCLAVTLVLFRYNVFDSTPAAGTIGEQAIAQETDDLILIADDDGEVIMRNETANSTLPLGESDAIGESIERSLGVAIEALRSQETVEIQTEDGVRQFDPQVTTLADQHGRQIGTMVSLRDVTEREIRRQRLEVLNRIVRHNLRNQASVIKANTEAVADELTDEQLQSYIDSATDSVDELTALGQKAKTIEDLLDRDDQTRAQIDLDRLLDEIAAETSEQWPSATVTVQNGDTCSVHSDRAILQFILSNLVENAVEHADNGAPTVELRAICDGADQYPVTIEVADDGPGIPDREVEVIEAGTETPLKHGSGVGLWVTNWAVRELGGELAFPERGPGGSTVHVRLPHEPRPTEGATGDQSDSS
jgi:signal transduction histidine kinase